MFYLQMLINYYLRQMSAQTFPGVNFKQIKMLDRTKCLSLTNDFEVSYVQSSANATKIVASQFDLCA